MNLPKVPRGWNELSWEQLVGIWKIFTRLSREDQRTECYLEVYRLLTNVSFRVPDVEELPEGSEREKTYVLEWTDKEHKKEACLADVGALQLYLMGFHVEEKKYQEERDGVLEWLEKPQGLTRLPLEFIKIGRRRYSMPAPMMTSLTYQQYGNMQKILQAFWQTEKALAQRLTQIDERIRDREGGLLSKKEMEIASDDIGRMSEEADEIARQAGMLRAQFLAHALNGRKFRITKSNNGGTNLSAGWVYGYNVEDAEKQVKQMRKADDLLFNILQQWFQGCISYYRDQMPELFTGEKGMDMRSPLMSEIDTVNSIMKWKGAYTTQQEVYDTNAIFILGDLKDMTKEAREIEKAQSKMHRKR